MAKPTILEQQPWLLNTCGQEKHFDILSVHLSVLCIWPWSNYDHN